MRRVFYRLLISLLFLPSLPALAHKPSDSLLTLKTSADGHTVSGQWDIALRDLDFQLGLDSNRDGSITWKELEQSRSTIESLAFSRLTIRQGERPCAIVSQDLLFDRHSDGGYAVLQFTAACPRRIEEVDVEYRLFFDIDRQHKGLLKLNTGEAFQSAVFDAETPRKRFRIANLSVWQHFSDYTNQGVWHIWIGVDHILFLLALLLPAVYIRQSARWSPVASFRPAAIEVVKIVTAFTVAHSITLSAATLGWVQLPSRIVESIIALSVAVAALNNLAPKVAHRRWLVAFGFGLIHGFGFASVLADLGLPDSALLVALLGFNAGVELGQLAIVGAFLPVAYAIRSTRLYESLVFRSGSVLIGCVASLWFAERAFDLKFMPF